MKTVPIPEYPRLFVSSAIFAALVVDVIGCAPSDEPEPSHDPIAAASDDPQPRYDPIARAKLSVTSPYTLFESGQVRPLALSPSGKLLFAVNTPDNRITASARASRTVRP